jgi:hypothetical protein
MADARGGWINFLAGAIGGLTFAIGIVGLMGGFSIRSSFLAVLGFLVAGWAALDYRRYRAGSRA